MYLKLTFFLHCVSGLTILQATWGNVPHRGVFTDKSSIPKGTRFGPFQGKLVNTSEIKTYDDNTLMWEVICPFSKPCLPHEEMSLIVLTHI